MSLTADWPSVTGGGKKSRTIRKRTHSTKKRLDSLSESAALLGTPTKQVATTSVDSPGHLTLTQELAVDLLVPEGVELLLGEVDYRLADRAGGNQDHRCDSNDHDYLQGL